MSKVKKGKKKAAKQSIPEVESAASRDVPTPLSKSPNLIGLSRSDSLVGPPLPRIGSASSKKLSTPPESSVQPPPPPPPPPLPPPPQQKGQPLPSISSRLPQRNTLSTKIPQQSSTRDGSGLNEWLTSEMLSNGKMTLKRAGAPKNGIRIDRDNLFDVFETPDHFPLQRLRDVFPPNTHINIIGLVGVDQVTDLFLFCINHLYAGSMHIRYASNIHLNGCVHLTDLGIKYLIQTFPELRKVYLPFCPKVTNDGLALMARDLKSIENIVLSGGDISVSMPLEPKRTNVITRLKGCPQIVPPIAESYESVTKSQYLCDLLETPPHSTHKVVIVNGLDSKCSVVDILRKKKTPTNNPVQEVVLKPSDGFEFNIVECLPSLSHVFSTSRTTFVVTFSLDDDINKSLPKVIKIMTHILLQQPAAVFCLAGITESGQPVCTVEKMAELLVPALSDVNDKKSMLSDLKNTIKKEIIDHLYVESLPLNFEQQQIKVNLCRLFEGIQNHLKSRLILCTVNAKNASEAEQALGKSFKDAASIVHSQYPAYEHLPSDLLTVLSTVPKLKKVQEVNSIAKKLREENRRKYGRNLRTYVKMLELMTILGKAVIFEAKEETFVVTDVGWFADLLSRIMTTACKADDLHKSLHPETPVLPLSALVDGFKSLVSPETEIVKTVQLVVEGLNLGWVDDKAVMLSSFLHQQPPVPLAQLLKDDIDDISVSVDFTMDMLLPEGAIYAFLARVSHDLKPLLIWNRGVLVYSAPVQVIIQFMESEFGIAGPGITKVNITAKMICEKIADDMVAKIIKLPTEVLSYYRLLLKHVLKQWNISYSDKVTVKAQDPKITGGFPHKADTFGGIVMCNRHNLNLEANKGSMVCSVCGRDEESLKEIWNMESDIHPCLCAKTWSSYGMSEVNNKGNWFDIPPGFKQEVSGIKWKVELLPESFRKFSINIAAGTKLGISVETSDETFTLKKNGEKEPTLLMKGEETVRKVSDFLEVGNTIEVRLINSIEAGKALLSARGEEENTPEKTLPEKAPRYAIQFVLGGEVIWEVQQISRLGQIIFSVYSTVQMSFYMNVPLCVKSQLVNTWQVGMRLEAKDRQNPRLICVASVDGVSDDGKEVTIHFDGWTSRYDYVADVTSEDLHPIGYIAHMTKIKLNARLEAPNRYNKVFAWPSYLSEIGQSPVPHSLFSKAQTEGCPEMDVISNEDDPRTMSAIQLSTCSEKDLTTRVLHKRINRIEVPPSEVFDKANELLAPLLVILPASITLSSLKYPRPTGSKDCALYSVCIINGFSHFIDMEGQYNEEMMKEMMSCWPVVVSFCFLMHCQKNFLPTGIRRLVKDGSDISHKQLTEYFREMIFDTIVSSFMKRQTSPSSQEEIYKKICNDAYTHATEKGDLAELIKNVDETYLCAAHAVPAPGGDFTSVPLKELSSFWELTVELKLQKNKITELPADLFSTLPELRHLNLASNQLSQLPSFEKAKSLTFLDVSENKIASLPSDLGKCTRLSTLNISRNALTEMPECVSQCTSLTKLDMHDMGLTTLPDDMRSLKKLKFLDVSGNVFMGIPAVLGELTDLTELDVSGVAWFSEYDNARSVLTRAHFDDVMAANIVTAKLSDKVKSTLFNGEHGGQNTTVGHEDITRINTSLYTTVPRLGRNCTAEGGTEDGQKEAEDLIRPIFNLTALVTLKMKYLAIREIPKKISTLTKLQVLDLSHCPSLEAISSDVVKCKEITALNIKDCGSLKTPPKEIVRRGFLATMGYLKRLSMGSVTCKRTKLMMVGLGGAGKTSTIKAIMSDSKRYNGDLYVTDGIDIMSWDVCYEQSTKEDNTITFSVWDFAGQTVYYNTHQFFLSNRAVYLLMWNVRLGHEHAGLDFWLSSIACHAPKAPVLVIGTHVDQVEKFWLPQESLRKRFPQIVGFHAVSSYTGEGIMELSKEIYYVGLREKYMGEKIPQAWLNFEKSIVRESKPKGDKEASNLLEWEELENLAEQVGIIDDTELKQVTHFLHDLGSLQHFDNDFLKSKVVINPQWIVNVMSCVVSVHENEIKDGKILHADLDKIWNLYPKNLHRWLLRLTEEFDLTFPLLDEPANLVACLLPDKEPEFQWPDVNDIPGQHETKMLYKFEYLPAGLFNRAQVRLSQFSDSSIIWKKGSLLHKTGHKALMIQKGSDVEVKVQGHCPENFLFLVHEVFETLIVEAYNGVTYDFLVPCCDCIKVGTTDPCMFEASKIRRATELKVPFLQCDKYFHTLSLTEVQGAMPPDTSTDFDAHLERNLRDLTDLKSDMETDIFLFYCSKDVPGIGEDDKKVAPRKIYQDLVDEGFKVWFSPDPDSVNLKSIAITMKNAKLVLMMLSDAFVQDDQCCNVFYYAQNTLHKKLQIVVLGGSMWQKTDIGLQMAAEVYVNMNNPARYKHKKAELVEALTSKTAKKKMVHPKCFISYCWSNSMDAIKKGSRKLEGALGWGDPRAFKQDLESCGISCWMDIEQVGQGGLFEDIAEGLKHAKVVIACVSDEYTKSKNCQMELRFASAILKLPIIVVIVGTGYAWEASEVGMLVLGSPKINAQHESTSVKERILDAVQGILPEEETETEVEKGNDDAQQQAFQELLELAQRKFLRQVSGYASSVDIGQYPRLFFIDFVKEGEKDSAGKPLFSDKENADKQDMDRYVVRILCEHDQGWHVPGFPILMPSISNGEMDEFLKRIAPFGARMMAILKHTAIDYPCFNLEKGDVLRKKFEDNCTLNMDFKDEYNECREYLMQLDKDHTKGGLTQCHMPNGKVLWLCKEHASTDDRISSMADDGLVVQDSTTIDLSKSQDKTTRLRGKLQGAAAAACVAGAMTMAHQSSKTCTVM